MRGETGKVRVALLGASGQLGRCILAHVAAGRHTREASEAVQIKSFQKPGFDLTDMLDCEAQLRHFSPQVVVNTAAYTAVDQAEIDPDRAFEINARSVEKLAHICRCLGARLVHVSTDYVFSGTGSTAMTPQDAPGPINVYGASKLAGEQAIAACLGLNWVVIRTAWLYALHGRNFVNTMLRLMREKSVLSVVDDQVSTPTSGMALAQVLWQLVFRPEITGIYHWVNAGQASWYQFARQIYTQGQALGLLSKKVEIVPVTSDVFASQARRPGFSRLDASALEERLGMMADEWTLGVTRVLQAHRDTLR